MLADRLAQFVHFFTLNYSLRPFGASAVVAGHDAFKGTHELYVVEPSGVSYVRCFPRYDLCGFDPRGCPSLFWKAWR